MRLTLGIAVMVLLSGCHTAGGQRTVSYEQRKSQAEKAFKEDRLFEAKRWILEALEIKPHNLEAQKLMAKILDREIAREKSLPKNKSPEEFNKQEKKIQIKTWLERSEGFMQAHEFDQALLSAEQVFQLDPGNLEASHQIDTIKNQARAEGKEESLFLQDLYEEEIQTRIRRYHEQLEVMLKSDRPGATRLTAEKILLLNPKDARARKVIADLDQKEGSAEARKTF